MAATFTTTTGRSRKHHADNGAARCGTEGATIALTEVEAEGMKMCFLCEGLPAPAAITSEEETSTVLVGERIADFLVTSILDKTTQTDLIDLIEDAPTARYGNGARKTLTLTPAQREELAEVIDTLHTLMRLGSVKTTATGFRANILPALAETIRG